MEDEEKVSEEKEGIETAENLENYITIGEEEWLKILKSYIKLGHEIGDNEIIKYYQSMYDAYQDLKRRDYVLEFYYNLSNGRIKLYARTREEHEIYIKKLTEIYGII